MTLSSQWRSFAQLSNLEVVAYDRKKKYLHKMKPLTGATRTAFLIFFISHVPITFLVDSQALLPSWLYPQAIRELLDFYVNFVNDPLMARPAFAGPWFQSFVVGELLFQLPFFCLAVRMMLSSTRTTFWPDWFRTACIIYGTHTSTTLIPILAQVIFNPDSNTVEKLMTVSVYLPYLIFPVWLTVLAVMDTSTNTTKSKTR
jgi:hypothetical protein